MEVESEMLGPDGRWLSNYCSSFLVYIRLLVCLEIGSMQWLVIVIEDGRWICVRSCLAGTDERLRKWDLEMSVETGV